MRSITLVAVFVTLVSCTSNQNEILINQDRQQGNMFITEDNTKIFVYAFTPIQKPKATIYIISGIIGINHRAEKDVIDSLSNNLFRIVVIHPRGTGYSDGKRGSLKSVNKMLEDYIEIIKSDQYTGDKIIFGHSMSCSFAVSIANKTDDIKGVILVNPPVILKQSKGMTPSLAEYAKYVFYMVFSPNSPIVNMAGDPLLIKNEQERKDSEERNKDPLLVKYFSMNMMIQTKGIMDSIVDNAKASTSSLLLIYGTADSIISEDGCVKLFDAWKSDSKTYIRKFGLSHGKETVIQSRNEITEWVNKRAEL